MKLLSTYRFILRGHAFHFILLSHNNIAAVTLIIRIISCLMMLCSKRAFIPNVSPPIRYIVRYRSDIVIMCWRWFGKLHEPNYGFTSPAHTDIPI